MLATLELKVVCFILAKLIAICEAYHAKVNQLEEEKYDMEKEVEFKDYKVIWIDKYNRKIYEFKNPLFPFFFILL